ncbi:MAG: hypothetical protein WD770_00770 [Actinomycetota bacterium]
MTTQKTFKRRVRARMAKTGERYTAARRILIANGDRPDTAPLDFEPPASGAALTKATGHGWEHWLGVLDEWGAASWSHGEIVRRLIDEEQVSGWYAQCITVGFERATGLRAPGQRKNGFAVTATKTIAAPVERLFRAFEDEAVRERWLPGAEMRRRTATAPKGARYDWEDGSTRVVVWFEKVDAAKSRVALEHEKLPDAETADEMKAWWRERVAALKTLLEGDA